MYESKCLNYNCPKTSLEDVDDVLPKIKYEDVPEEFRKNWSKKSLIDLSEEEFEQWLACELEFNNVRYVFDSDSPENAKDMPATQEDQRSLAEYHRAEYRHIKRFAAWRKVNLDPLVEELGNMAMYNPQYDWHYLYQLEQQKLICMERYLSHSRVADSDGDYVGKKWLVLCITLLDYILDKKEVTKEQVQKMNISNIKGLVDDYTLQQFKESTFSENEEGIYCDRLYYGKEIYVRKIERLYHLIRLYKTRNWWE